MQKTFLLSKKNKKQKTTNQIFSIKIKSFLSDTHVYSTIIPGSLDMFIPTQLKKGQFCSS